jgi:hypothetical protein
MGSPGLRLAGTVVGVLLTVIIAVIGMVSSPGDPTVAGPLFIAAVGLGLALIVITWLRTQTEKDEAAELAALRTAQAAKTSEIARHSQILVAGERDRLAARVRSAAEAVAAVVGDYQRSPKPARLSPTEAMDPSLNPALAAAFAFAGHLFEISDVRDLCAKHGFVNDPLNVLLAKHASEPLSVQEMLWVSNALAMLYVSAKEAPS